MTEVLVVDDDPDIRMLVSFALEDAGYTVRQASDGDAALAAIARKAPDVVVLDVMMPGRDGFDVLKGIRSQSAGNQTRVLMLTTKISERDHLRGWGVGADDYLTKPFDPEELAERVKWLLRAPEGAREARRAQELQKADLLDRLEVAFNKTRAGSTHRGPWDGDGAGPV